MSPLWRGPVVTAEDWRPGFFAWLRDDDVLGDPVPLVYALTAKGPAFRNEVKIEGHPLATGWAVLNDERQPLFVQPGKFWPSTTLHLAMYDGPPFRLPPIYEVTELDAREVIGPLRPLPGPGAVSDVQRRMQAVVDRAVAAAITECGRELNAAASTDDVRALVREWLDATWEQLQ